MFSQNLNEVKLHPYRDLVALMHPYQYYYSDRLLYFHLGTYLFILLCQIASTSRSQSTFHQILSMGVCWSFMWTQRHHVNLAVDQSVSQSISESICQSVRQLVSHLVDQLVVLSDSQLLNQNKEIIIQLLSCAETSRRSVKI